MNAIQFFIPAVHFLAWLIYRHAGALSAFFTYIGLPWIAWILGRRSGRKKAKQSHTFILVLHPPAQSTTAPPPVIRWNCQLPSDD